MNTSEKYFSIISSSALRKKYNVQRLSIELEPHMVNPITNEIERDISLNTNLRWWVEVIADTEPDEYGCTSEHIWELDCGGNTAEEAIDVLYDICQSILQE